MSERDWKRLDVIKRVEKSELTGAEGAQVLGITPRWLRKLREAVRCGGRGALAHGNVGRAPANRLDEDVRKTILELALTTYVGFNDQHFTEKLVEVEKIAVSRSSVRRLLREAKIGLGRTRRAKKHRRRRDRKPQAGLMILWDGSRHDWLEGRGPMMCLMGAIDDATGELLPGAHFVDQECAASYLRTLHTIVREKGIPHAAYGDRHGALKRNDDHWTIEEELRGEQDLTHVGHALRDLEIEPIHALSPQAKGRVERLWKTLQDRLTSELRLARASTCEEANQVLQRHAPDHNRRFAIAPKDAVPAWRPVRQGVDIDRVCSFRYKAVVGNDNAVRLAGHVFDIPPGPGGRTYAKARAEIRQLLDGSWRVYVKDSLVASVAASPLAELKPLRHHKRSAADKAFGRSIRSLETPTERAEKKPRPIAKRSPVPPPFNSFGRLKRTPVRPKTTPIVSSQGPR